MAGGVERLLRAADRFQQRHSLLATPVAAVAQFPVLGTHIEGSIRTIEGSGVGLVMGVLGTLWGGLGITQSARDAMNALWNIPYRHRPSYWWRLARGLGSLVPPATGVALAQVGRIRPGPAGPLAFAGSLLLNLLLLVAMFQVLTGRWVAWRRLLPGAAFAAVGWSALQTLACTSSTGSWSRPT
jgi:membrane protein